jgi:L-ribulokinase
MSNENYVIGLDYGSDSVRSVIINAITGEEIAGAVHYYTRWQKGLFCDPAQNQFRQHPLDYLEGLEYTIKTALKQAPDSIAANIKSISIDTTGSTPVAVDKSGTALALTPKHKNNPNAMFVLWKDHTAIKEAEEINTLAETWGGTDYTKYCGGIYSSEWFWAKMLHILRVDETIREDAFSWVEHCDWLPGVLTGQTDPLTLKRSRCAAGHKAMWHEEFGGLPSQEFLSKLDPLLDTMRERLFTETYTSDTAVGTLTREWADKLGLSTSVIIGVGAFDAHMGAVGAEIKPGAMSKVMGTSTCDMLIAPIAETDHKLIKGICGQVDGSIVPGMLGMEAGQSAFGDVYAWFRKMLLTPVEEILSATTTVDSETRNALIDEISDQLLQHLEKQAEKIDIGSSGLVALDWINGRRTPDANQQLKGAISGISMGSDAARIFRALVEATAFGSKCIADRFIDEGVEIHEVIALGGVAKKSSFVMQVIADVLNMEIKVAHAEQACALGAAMFATVIAGIYPHVDAAQEALGRGFEACYKPIPENVEKYKELYRQYCNLGTYVETAQKAQ